MSINHFTIPLLVLAASLSLFVSAQAVTYQTYIIHTYGGSALLPAVRQQLNASSEGGTVTTYQDKLVLQTTAANYQRVKQLLTQIDAIKRQSLNSTIIVPRGQWVDIGEITQNSQNQNSGYGNSRSSNSSTSAPISILIQ